MASFVTFEIDADKCFFSQHFFISEFGKSLTFHQIIEYVKIEKFRFLIVENIDSAMFGFDLSNDTEYDIAENIITDNWCYSSINDLIRGWKVAKDLPSWVKKVSAWHKFEKKAEKSNLGQILDLDENKDEDTKSGEEKNINDDEDSYINDNESNVSDDNEDNVKLNHSDDNYGGLYDSMDSEKEEDKSHTPNTKVYMSHHDNIKEYDYEDYTSEEDSVILHTRSNTKLFMSQHKNENQYESDNDTSEDEKDKLLTRSNTTMNKLHHKKKTNESDEDDSSFTVGMGKGYSNNKVDFETLFDNNFKSKFKDNVKTVSKPGTTEVFVTGPFHIKDTDMSYYVVVFGDLNKAFVLKSMFIKSYLATVLSVSGLNKECTNCNTFYDFNISKLKFGHGDDNCWKRTKTGKTISRLQFVYSCKSSQEKQIEKNLSRMIDVLFKSMEMRTANPIGELVLDYLKLYQDGLFMYLTKGKTEENVSTMLTEDIHNQFKSGYTITWNDNLNRFMVDFDIIRILKNDIGYKNWDDVGKKNMSKCYKDINATFTLPQWNIEQERY